MDPHLDPLDLGRVPQDGNAGPSDGDHVRGGDIDLAMAALAPEAVGRGAGGRRDGHAGSPQRRGVDLLHGEQAVGAVQDGETRCGLADDVACVVRLVEQVGGRVRE